MLWGGQAWLVRVGAPAGGAADLVCAREREVVLQARRLALYGTTCVHQKMNPHF